jgi:hypothetical protein
MPDGNESPGTEASGEQGTAASGEATGTPTPPASEAPAGGSGGVDHEALARTWQSRYDQAQAQIAELRASQASSSDGAGTAEGKAAASPDPAAAPITQADLFAALGRMNQMSDLASELRTEYPNASSDVFSNPMAYDSPEAFLAAARTSHESRSADEKAIRDRVDAEWRERLGPLAKQFETPASGADSGTATGQLTIEQWLGMSLKEKEAYYAEHQEAVDKLLASVG